jgi:zinc transport system ATP-binding protein
MQPPVSQPPAIVVRELCVTLTRTEVLHDVSLEVASGSFVGILGPNGGGKTTLLRTLVGIQAPTCGTIRVLGHEPRSRAARQALAYVPQNASHVDAKFPATAREVVMLGRLGVGAPWRRMTKDDARHVEEAMREVGVWDLRERPIGQLSGGQRQRVFLAKAMAVGPKLLLLDEPTTGVDAEARANFYGILRHLHRDHAMTVVMVSHEASHVKLLADKLVVIDHKKRFDGSPKEYEASEDAAHVHDVAHSQGEGPHEL